MEKCVESRLQKQNGRNFQLKKFLFIDFVLTERSLSDKRPKSTSDKSSSCLFSFSAERNANPKATEHVTFGFSFSILVFFPFWESLNLTACQQYGFFSVLAAIIRESSDKQLVLRIVKALPFIHQLDWLAISTHVKKYDIFSHVCCYGFSQGRKSLFNTAVYVINKYTQSFSKTLQFENIY